MASGSVDQAQKLSADQTENNAKTQSWKTDDITRLRRFLSIGSEGGSFFIEPKQLGRENAQSILSLIADGKGPDVVNEIVKFSDESRTVRMDAVIFALALCARSQDLKTKQEAYKVLAGVCRIPTHLFKFIDNAQSLSAGPNMKTPTGWGRAQRKAIKDWYNKKDPKDLAVAVTKYKRRGGWSHVDVIRLAHIKGKNEGIDAVLKYSLKGLEETKKEFGKEDASDDIKALLLFFEAVETVRHSQDEQQVARLVEQHSLVWEHVPTWLMNSKEVWTALLPKMPMTALLKKLGKMTSLGILDPLSNQSKVVIERLTNREALEGARIHPFSVLLALKTYEQGKSEKGKLTWTPNDNITKALNEAFLLAFKHLKPTNKRYLIAIDVSKTMSDGGVNGAAQIPPLHAAAAMAMAIAKTEKQYIIKAFSKEIVDVSLNGSMSLEDAVKTLSQFDAGTTDCASPIRWAKDNKKPVDVFLVFTDHETMAGPVHPAEELRQYRKAIDIWDARLVVCAMTSTGFTLADPEDPGMLDIAGFDAACPQIIHDFAMGLM